MSIYNYKCSSDYIHSYLIKVDDYEYLDLISDGVSSNISSSIS